MCACFMHVFADCSMFIGCVFLWWILPLFCDGFKLCKYYKYVSFYSLGLFKCDAPTGYVTVFMIGINKAQINCKLFTLNSGHILLLFTDSDISRLELPSWHWKSDLRLNIPLICLCGTALWLMRFCWTGVSVCVNKWTFVLNCLIEVFG